MRTDPPNPKRPPNRAAETVEREAERKKRLAEALRANLRRRKTPGRDAEESEPSGDG